jgi:hypothetical protein
LETGKTVIKAKDGELISSEESSILQLVLNDGYYYEDIVPKNTKIAANYLSLKFL